MRTLAIFCAVSLAFLCFFSDLRAAEESRKADATPTPASENSWGSSGAALVRSHCLDCHNDDNQEAEVNLAGFDKPDAIAANPEMWQRALDMIKFGAMPPADAESLSDDQRATLADSLEAVLFSAACDLAPKPGKVTVRRLNRAEYDNTVSDLFGLPLSIAASFPADEVGAGFDNNGDVLSIPPMLFEKYMAGAEEVASQVIFDPDSVQRDEIQQAGDQILTEGESWVGSFFGHFLHQDAFAWTEVEVPYDGRYRLDVRGGAPQPDQHVQVGVFDASGILIEVCEFDYFGGGGGSDHESLKMDLKRGRNRILFALLKPDAEAKAGETKLASVERLNEERLQAGRERVGKKLGIDGKIDEQPVAFMVRKLSVKGPEGTPPELIPVSHKKLLRQFPSKQRSAKDAAKVCLEEFLPRAFRSPVDDHTVDQYARLAEMAFKKEKSFERAMRVTISAALVSPRFLFRVELPPADESIPAGEVRPLTNHQLASRLSYFLWSSMPDAELLRLADEGKLDDEQELRRQVARMLADERAGALAENFAAQWLGLRNLDDFVPDPTKFPQFDEDLRTAMRSETLLLFGDVVKNNDSVLRLLDSPKSFVNERLAKHYGIGNVQGDEFRLVAVRERGRAGILTHASVLTLTSNPGRTSPVKRGKWVLENLLGTRPPDPPAGVPELEETTSSNPNASLREQLELHRSNATCASCHSVMDDLGFGLENFNALGGYRDDDEGKPIDASGTLPGGRSFNGALPLIDQLRKTESKAFVNTMANRLLTFAIGRELVPADRCFVADIVAASAEHDYRFVDLATAVVLSKPFRFHTLEEK